MKISTTPANYTGAFTDVIYTVTEAIPEQIVEVTVLGENAADVLGIKRYRGQAGYEVNISNYIRRRLDAIPAAYARCSAYTPEKRSARASIKVGSLSSPQCTFIGGYRHGTQYALLSDAPAVRTIAPGEIDEIPLIGAATRPSFAYGFLTRGDDVREMVFSIGGLGEMLVFQINADDIADLARSSGLGDFLGYSHLEVSVELNSILTMVRKYEITPRRANTVRLCWVNPYGALDFHTFARTETETVAAERKKLYTSEGYKCCASHSERFMTVESGFENAETLMWLSGIVGSPKAWIYGAGGFTEVDILTDSVSSGKNAPASLRLTMRERRRETHQNF